ncbi:hypothetical protein TSUD_329960 [Trifolium subterraneum]|nr:hypothetical protein TSUD_329960 [Trifolium subterraneum]
MEIFGSLLKFITVRMVMLDSCSHVMMLNFAMTIEQILFKQGWWYSVIGHLETCQEQGNHCQCHNKGKSIH